mmetsp:Transcript_22651/g.57675  ORF Transcript_22651/g.57675 Transcript_22651/m.57675 type:complete len:324 (+) Transcript_22651:218-1189(+)
MLPSTWPWQLVQHDPCSASEMLAAGLHAAAAAASAPSTSPGVSGALQMLQTGAQAAWAPEELPVSATCFPDALAAAPHASLAAPGSFQGKGARADAVRRMVNTIEGSAACMLLMNPSDSWLTESLGFMLAGGSAGSTTGPGMPRPLQNHAASLAVSSRMGITTAGAPAPCLASSRAMSPGRENPRPLAVSEMMRVASVSAHSPRAILPHPSCRARCSSAALRSAATRSSLPVMSRVLCTRCFRAASSLLPASLLLPAAPPASTAGAPLGPAASAPAALADAADAAATAPDAAAAAAVEGENTRSRGRHSKAPVKPVARTAASS